MFVCVQGCEGGVAGLGVVVGYGCGCDCGVGVLLLVVMEVVFVVVVLVLALVVIVCACVRVCVCACVCVCMCDVLGHMTQLCRAANSCLLGGFRLCLVFACHVGVAGCFALVPTVPARSVVLSSWHASRYVVVRSACRVLPHRQVEPPLAPAVCRATTSHNHHYRLTISDQRVGPVTTTGRNTPYSFLDP